MSSVVIDGESVTIPRFTGFKTTRVTRLLATIGKAYPDVLTDVAEFTRAYESSHAIRITPDMAKMPRFARWKLKPADFGEKGYVEIPQSPSGQAQLIKVFPTIVEKAQTEATQILALVIMSNRALEEADEQGGDEAVDALIAAEARKLLHRADIPELLEIAIAAFETVRANFDDKRDRLGKAFASMTTQTPEPSSIENDATERDLSIASPEPTAGLDEKSSIASTG